MSTTPPLLAVISGPSAVGKDAVMSALLAGDDFARAITMTTRPPRPGEVDGVHYVFASSEAFRAAVRSGELVEHAEVHGRLYGTPRAQLRSALASGRDVLLQVDVQGAIAIRETIPDARLIFIAPESLEQIEQRLRERGTPPIERALRIASARAELEQQGAFDTVIVNAEDDLEGTVAQVRAWIARERARPGRRAVEV